MTDLSGFTRASFLLLCILGMSVVISGFPAAQLPLRVDKAWLGHWSSPGTGVEKRGMVVADDVAFREKSKLLTAMERQKWLNSYMQKILMVNA